MGGIVSEPQTAGPVGQQLYGEGIGEAAPSLVHFSCKRPDFLLQASNTSSSICRYALNIVLRQQTHCACLCCKIQLNNPCCTPVCCVGFVREGWGAQRPLLYPIHNTRGGDYSISAPVWLHTVRTHESGCSEGASAAVPGVSSHMAIRCTLVRGHRALQHLAGRASYLIWD